VPTSQTAGYISLFPGAKRTVSNAARHGAAGTIFAERGIAAKKDAIDAIDAIR
jgi:hypothetical protein